MPIVARNCPHILNHGDLRIIEAVFNQKEKFIKCSDCDNEGPDLWLCLYPDCRWVGCTEGHLDHSTIHNNKYPMHCAHMNLSTNRIWCYMCEREVITRHIPSPPVSPTQMDIKLGGHKFIGDGPISINYKTEADMRILFDRFYNLDSKFDKTLFSSDAPCDSAETTDSEESRDIITKPRGLVGLQNIGNTCYMNSALQALSNVVPLTQYFLDCGQSVPYIVKDRKPGLSLSYMNLIKDMWNRRTRGYVVPSGILSGIRVVNPMFRGYHQHDTQEFLRCFMDQLHEELKERVDDDNKDLYQKLNEQSSSEEETAEMDGSSQSDGEYETCDSGVSEQSSISDEGERGTKRRYSRLSQADKLRSKFTARGIKKSIDDQYQQRSLQNSPKSRCKKQMKTRSIISDTFDGKLLSSVQCLMCDRVSTRVETFQDLSLPIPSRDHIDMLHHGTITPQKSGPCTDIVYVNNQTNWIIWLIKWMRSWFWGPVVSLHDCLSAFFSADELKGDNMYSCEKCNKLRNGIKYSKVLELPEILCIHLKRFRHELMFSSKIANYVSFPLNELDMRPYLHKDCISKVTNYDLISVICHHGTAGGGHYTCYALNNDVNQWFEFDDQCVTQVTPETVKNCEAYVLFYKKSSQDIVQCRDRIVELMENASRESELNFYVSRQWINRFNTFSEPGPIDNSDFLCPHGGVNPFKAKFIDKISKPLSQGVWEHLYSCFGGGPACTQLFECPVCEENYEIQEKRRQYELEIFQRYNNGENPTAIYALAMSWLRQWQSFVKGKEGQPPGPIDNSSIVITVNGQKVLKPGSDCSQVSEEVWQFFVKIYGGGPELMLQPCQRPTNLQPNISLHSASAPNLMEPTLKPNNRTEAKTNKIIITKSTETISQQDSAIESIASDSDSVKSQRDLSG